MNATCVYQGCIKPARSRRLCNAHYKQGLAGQIPLPARVSNYRKPVEERFWEKVSGSGVDTCWEWQGWLPTHGGYGKIFVSGKAIWAHRWAYEALRAEIPDGLHLDHLCRNPPCVNPWHLEPVTVAVNVQRGAASSESKCRKGHSRTPENTSRNNRGDRVCLACERDRRAAAARRAVAVPRGAWDGRAAE